jgi:putative sigma-54 modulation protein
MNVTIHGHNLKVSDTLEDFARKKLDKLDRYLPNIMEIRVDLSRQQTARGEDFAIAQITLRHGRGAILRAEEKVQSNDRESVQMALNLAVDKMYRRIERFKGKRSRKGRERFTATLEELEIAEEIPELDEQEETFPAIETDEDLQVVRRKQVAVTAMNEAEAIEQMELLGHTFFMFFNADTGSVNVLYKRTDGGYGVLVPQVQ